MDNCRKDNNLAIRMLLEGNELLAQNILRYNLKKYRCNMTLNNLGVFYCQNGMIQKNAKWKSAKRLGLRYLIEALQEDAVWQSYVSAATALEENGDYRMAYKLLQTASSLKADILVQYNIGVCLFRLGKMLEAITVLEQLLESETVKYIIANGGQSPLIIIIYAYIALGENDKAINQLNCSHSKFHNDDRFDVFILQHLCGLHFNALHESEKLLAEWYPTSALLAMLAESVNFEPAFNEKIIVSLPETFMEEWREFLKKPKKRRRAISRYKYVPPYLMLYYYIKADKTVDGSVSSAND